ncbi:MAG TPA: DsbA family protein [Kofleriaceae bacterium]|jgi:2-hydroxychromene-2-carboxylate isomerase
MIIAKRLKGKAIATWLGPTGDAVRGAAHKLRTRISGDAERRLDFYFDVADPWSYLAAQVVERLVETYGVPLAFHPITPPASDVAPQPLLRAKQAVRDAQQLADYYDLAFTGKREADSGSVRDAGTVLVRDRPPREQLRAALELGRALWANDKKQMALLLGSWGHESHGTVAPVLNANYAKLRKAGHYEPGAVHYAGDWYAGVDRIRYLEEVLAADTGKSIAGVLRERTDRAPEKLSEKPLTCELWISFASPYAYLGIEQIEGLLAPYDIPLVLRPIRTTSPTTPPTVKRMYLALDAKREADRLGIPFGELCELSERGKDHCLAIAHWAAKRSQRDVLAFARSAMRGIWAEARDLGEYVDLRTVVERAGLPWDEARAALDATDWVKATTAHATDLAVYGLWGVPSVKVGDFVAWGQDRFPLLADRLRRHAAC